MAKIVISNGSFTSLIVSTILKDSIRNTTRKKNIYFVGYLKNISSFLHQKHFDFASFFIPYTHFINLCGKENNISLKKEIFIKNIDSNDVITDIYIPINSRTKKHYNFFKKLYPNALFHLYEEGLMSYIKPLFSSSLRKIMLSCKNYYLIYDEKFKIYLKKNLNNIPITQINNQSLLNLIEEFNEKHNFNIKKYDNNKKYALILPQYYYEKKPKKFKELINMYKEEICYLLDQGYSVLFKEHPKANLSIFKYLKTEIKSKNFILVEDFSIYPIEMFIKKLNISLVFSVYSTSLFTIKSLFNINTFTSYKMLKHRISIFSIYPSTSAVITKNAISNLKNENNNKDKDLLQGNNLLLILYLKVLKFFH